MKAFIASAACLIAIALFVTVNAIICGQKVEKLETEARALYDLALQEKADNAASALTALRENWKPLRAYLARTLHNGYLASVDAQLDAASGALACHDFQALTVSLSKLRGTLQTLKNAVGKAHL